jgi:hypothetical protein
VESRPSDLGFDHCHYEICSYRPDRRGNPITIGLCAGLLAILHGGFVYGVWVKNHYDEGFFRYFSARAADLALDRASNLPVPTAAPKSAMYIDRHELKEFIFDGSSVFQPEVAPATLPRSPYTR